MKKLTSLLVLALLLSACTTKPEVSDEESANLTIQLIESGIRFQDYISDGYSGLSDWPFTVVLTDLELDPIEGLHPDQITAYYSVGDLGLALVSQPNTWTLLETVREWEKAGNSAWSGVLVKHVDGPWEVFLQIPEEDFNPVALFLEEEQLVLDLADDNGAGSGEGTLIRYVYPFGGVEENLLYQWTKEKCDGYYVPETYTEKHERSEC